MIKEKFKKKEKKKKNDKNWIYVSFCVCWLGDTDFFYRLSLRISKSYQIAFWPWRIQRWIFNPSLSTWGINIYIFIYFIDLLVTSVSRTSIFFEHVAVKYFVILAGYHAPCERFRRHNAEQRNLLIIKIMFT